MGAGGASSSSTGSFTSTSSGAGIGGDTCIGPPDGTCQYEQGEDCNCVDCLSTALCNMGQCANAGTTTCDHLNDSCTCANCSEDPLCADPTRANCRDAGACYPFTESCLCPNCWTDPACKASVAACANGKPDGMCDRSKEGCDCVDCWATPLCVPCSDGGACGGQACSCGSCVHQAQCNDVARCVDDGVCAIYTEGCICNDCKDLPECTRWFDAGVEGGSDASDGG
jgi:hypothetical protein